MIFFLPPDSSRNLSTKFKGIWTGSFSVYSFISTMNGLKLKYVTHIMLRNNLQRERRKKASTGGLFSTVTFSKYEIKTLLVAANIEIWAQLCLYTLVDIFKSPVFDDKNVSAFLQLVEMKALVGRGEEYYLLFIINLEFLFLFVSSILFLCWVGQLKL